MGLLFFKPIKIVCRLDIPKFGDIKEYNYLREKYGTIFSPQPIKYLDYNSFINGVSRIICYYLYSVKDLTECIDKSNYYIIIEHYNYEVDRHDIMFRLCIRHMWDVPEAAICMSVIDGKFKLPNNLKVTGDMIELYDNVRRLRDLCIEARKKMINNGCTTSTRRRKSTYD
jgi:hypothetical protein